MEKRGGEPNMGKSTPQLVQNQTILVDFKVDCSITKPGETVRVTGSCRELGDWIPKDGLNLITSPTTFPIWEGSTLIEVGSANQGAL